MSAENCPIQILPKQQTPDEAKRKDKFVSFNIPLDPTDPDSIKATHEFRKLDSTDTEDVLTFVENMDDIIVSLGVAAGAPRFRLIRSRIVGDPAK